MSTRRHARKHEALLRLWSLLIPPVTSRFSRQESQLLLHSRPSGFSAGTFNTTCYSMPGWSGSGLPDLFPFRTSADGTSHWNKLGFFGSIEWHISRKYLTWYQYATMDITITVYWRIAISGRRPHFWLPFSNSVCDTSVSVCVCVCG